jgi:hypothetical protein
MMMGFMSTEGSDHINTLKTYLNLPDLWPDLGKDLHDDRLGEAEGSAGYLGAPLGGNRVPHYIYITANNRLLMPQKWHFSSLVLRGTVS